MGLRDCEQRATLNSTGGHREGKAVLWRLPQSPSSPESGVLTRHFPRLGRAGIQGRFLLCYHSVFSESALLPSFSPHVLVEGLGLQGLDTTAKRGVVWGGVGWVGSWSGAQCWAWEAGKESGPGAFPDRSVKVLRKTDTTPGTF